MFANRCSGRCKLRPTNRKNTKLYPTHIYIILSL